MPREPQPGPLPEEKNQTPKRKKAFSTGLDANSMNEISKYIGIITRLSSVMVGSILLFFFAGLFITTQFNLNPIVTVIITLIGIVVGFVYMYKAMMDLVNEKPKPKK